MRLKYQMRGIGIGILVTALLMGISTGKGIPLSDAEIRMKASELGMVEGSSRKLSDLSSATQPPEASGTPASGEASAAPSEGTSEGQEEPPSSEEPEKPGEDIVTVVIEFGVTSSYVSKLLEEAGLVEDAEAFDQSLRSRGLSRSVVAGTYEISPGTSEEELIQMITK